MICKNILCFTGIALLFSICLCHGAVISRDTAGTVAGNWVLFISESQGGWNGSADAFVDSVFEFKSGRRLLGYFCSVQPEGCVIISLLHVLGPVKYYSTKHTLDPDSDRGMTALIKESMERMCIAIERCVGPMDSVSEHVLEDLMGTDFTEQWNILTMPPDQFDRSLRSDPSILNYQSGDVLLESEWHQEAPYNDKCPRGDSACADCCPSDPGVCQPGNPTYVGCVATAASQIFRYWAWPPHGLGANSYTWNDTSCDHSPPFTTLSASMGDSYDWAHIANEYHWDAVNSTWQDEFGNPLSQQYCDAVSELCYEAGIGVNMDYGVCASGAYMTDLENMYESYFRYSANCSLVYRNDYTAVNWFELMKQNFNQNRPVQYAIPQHSIVSDGWQEVFPGPTRFYHINYGWGGGNSGWFQLDNIPGGNPPDELMLQNIRPDSAVGSNFGGTFAQESFPYRYFAVDAYGSDAVFESGQKIQFLQHITVHCAATSTQGVVFEGTPEKNTFLFSRGDISRGIRIRNGAVKLSAGGAIRFE